MAATCPIQFDIATLHDSIRDVYTRVADDPNGDFHFHRGAGYAAQALGYDAEELATLPLRATSRFAGVGNPLAMASIAPGQTVLDHACGAGMDLLLAARRVGPTGKALGVDMTPRMREEARLSATEAGFSERVEIREGMFEELPVETGSVDIVISNGVINLAADKRRVFREIRRVLRPGGALCVADVVVQRELSLRARSEPELWAACVGGALVEAELLSLATEAGLVDGKIHARMFSFAGSSAEAKVSRDLGISAVHFWRESDDSRQFQQQNHDQENRHMLSMEAQTTNHDRYVRAISASKRARWDLDRDVLRERRLNPAEKFLPDGLSKVQTLDFLSQDARRFLGQIQGRTYANIFGLVERYINAKILDVSARHHLGDQTALEALVRFSDEEIKHQELFRRLEALCAEVMPPGYSFGPQPNEVAGVVLGKSTWAVLALTCHIELFTQAHYTESIAPDAELSPLFKDVFRFHWMEESQHAVLDELEWLAEDAKLNLEQRTRAVGELIELVAAIDGILQAQSAADATYFVAQAGPAFTTEQGARIREALLRAYRYQYIGSGLERTRFPRILSGLISADQLERVTSALAPLL